MSAAGEIRQHPERAIVRRVIDEGLVDLPVETNPLAIALGMHIRSAGEGRVCASFQVGAPFTQGNGFVQGGIISAMLDFGMVFAAFSQVAAGSSVTTVSQTTNFFRPVRMGEVIVEAELEKAGRTLIGARAVLRDMAGVLLASASAPIAVIPLAA